MFNTNWATKYAEGPRMYLGYDGTSGNMSFPGISRDAARFLVGRNITAVGIDTASLDPGHNIAFEAHRILLEHGVYGVENLNSAIEKVPPEGSAVMVFSMKITGGSGAPARVMAFVKNKAPEPKQK